MATQMMSFVRQQRRVNSTLFLVIDIFLGLYKQVVQIQTLSSQICRN